MKTTVFPASPKKFQVMVWRQSENRWQRFVGSNEFCEMIYKTWYGKRRTIGPDQWPEE